MGFLSSDTEAFLEAERLDRVDVALILGSGLNPLAEDLSPHRTIPYASIPHFPSTKTEGHRGNFHLCRYDHLALGVFEGRFHYHEGLTLSQVVYPVRLASALGAGILLVTNASGGINPELRRGDFLIIGDHINMMGTTPLIGMEETGDIDRFPDMSDAYSEELRQLAREACAAVSLPVHEGVLAAVPGPCYETPAEVRMLRLLGADAVSMSMVPEVIMARTLGMAVLGVSLISNRAAGLKKGNLDHGEVIKAGREKRREASALLQAILSKLSVSTAGKKGQGGWHA
ncbi:MAG: purine-nucleoside phosphorylase [bacterium]|nr:purine-nucleoside phosphorylase [bacterium]